jgi:hypothetical protein
MALVISSLRNTGNLLSNSTDNFDETALYNGSLLFDGYTYYAPSNTLPTVLGTGNFTIETWVYPTSYADMVLCSSTVDNNLQLFRLNQPGTAQGGVSIYNSAAQIFLGVGNTVPGQWAHLAWVKNGTTSTLYINGAVAASTTTAITNFNPNIIGVYVISGGGNTDNFGGRAQCYLKDFRISTSTAVYTTAFAVPTSPLPKLADTVLLLNVSDYYNRFFDAASSSTQLKFPLIATVNPPGFSSASPYAQTRSATQSKLTQNEIVYNELDEVSNSGSGTAFSLTNTGTLRISGIFDEVSGIPNTSTYYTTSGNYAHTIPSGVNTMIVEVWGGGGGFGGVFNDTGGNSPSYLSSWFSSPGAGGFASSVYNVSTLSGTVLQITVGAGGAGGGASSAVPGSTGTVSTVSTSSFAFTTMTANPGSGAYGNFINYHGAPGGTATGGNISNITGTNFTSTTFAGTLLNSEIGVYSLMPNGVWSLPVPGVPGYFGKSYGAGGAATGFGIASAIGGPGQAGAVVISYY